jgi:hypothetical protein
MQSIQNYYSAEYCKHFKYSSMDHVYTEKMYLQSKKDCLFMYLLNATLNCACHV